jgi:hypothetical protein
MRKTMNHGALLVADTISRLPESDKVMVREARRIATTRQRTWLREMEREFRAAKKEGRVPVGKPFPLSALG